MKSNTSGAWLIHHAKKIQAFEVVDSFEEVVTSGKCGLLLSLLTESENESTLSYDKVKLLATAARINHLELPTLLQKLKENHYIDVATSNKAVTALGLTTTSVLTNTDTIFKSSNPSGAEKAVIEIADMVSTQPLSESYVKEIISDTHHLSSLEVVRVLNQSEHYGLFDYERVDDKSDKIIFNGNLFRKEGLKKSQLVLNSLSSHDSSKLIQLDQLLGSKGCITLEEAKRIAGVNLLEKVQSIGMYDFLEVSNTKQGTVFITKPAAFSKFGNPFEEDALDLAKAFVASLSYGIHVSSQGRGKIGQLKLLMQKMINGFSVGPATAIGQDYRVLEVNRVVEIKMSTSYPGRYNMRLLKKDIGILALQVLESGDSASEEAVLVTSNVSKFTGPEATREQTRRKQPAGKSDMDIVEMLRTLK